MFSCKKEKPQSILVFESVAIKSISKTYAWANFYMVNLEELPVVLGYNLCNLLNNTYSYSYSIGIYPYPPSFYRQKIYGLNANTAYSVQIFVTYKSDTIFSNPVYFTTKADDYTISDIDGNKYHIVEVNGQTWLKENLKTTRFNNGDTISNITANNVWQGTNKPAYCSYDNDTSISNEYGWWTNSYSSQGNYFYSLSLSYDNYKGEESHFEHNNGLSIRCVQDW